MKCISRILIGIVTFVMCLSFVACDKKQEVTYDVYKTSDTYNLTKASTESSIPLVGDVMCVGGFDNTVDASVDSSFLESAAVFNTQTRDLPFAYNVYERVSPYAMTKLVLAYTAIKNADINESVIVSQEALNNTFRNSYKVGLEAGDMISVKDLIYCIILGDGSDAIHALTYYVAGSDEAFCELMNQELLNIGATNSHFTNVEGYDATDQYTTVYDMYMVINQAMQFDEFVNLISAKTYKVKYTGVEGNNIVIDLSAKLGYLTGDYESPAGLNIIGGRLSGSQFFGYGAFIYYKNSADVPMYFIAFNGNPSTAMYEYSAQVMANYSN